MTAEIAVAILTPMVLLSLGLSVSQMLRPHFITASNADPITPRAGESPAPGRTGLIIGPPMVEGSTLRDHVLHYSFDTNVWTTIGKSLYEIGAPHPKVGPYFYKADMKELPLHFTRMLVAVCHTGVSEKMLRVLMDRHARVTNPDGEPIDDEAYDVIKAVITMVITNKVVLPEGTLDHLDRVLETLRPAVVR